MLDTSAVRQVSWLGFYLSTGCGKFYLSIWVICQSWTKHVFFKRSFRFVTCLGSCASRFAGFITCSFHWLSRLTDDSCIRTLLRNWADLRLKYRDTFQKLSWLTTHLQGPFSEIDLADDPYFGTFLENITVRPIYIYMDFGPGDIGPYDPYVDLLWENIGRMTPKWPLQGEVRWKIVKSSKVNEEVRFSKSPLAISNSQFCIKILIIGID